MDKQYKTTKFKLTLLYFVIVFAIVAFFSIIIINIQFDQFNRIEQARAHDIQRLGYLDSPETDPFLSVIDNAKDSILARIFETDAVILLISALLSYYLAGKTLEPIEEAFEKQKQFIADASHELKTPLTAITTEAEVLLNTERTNEQYKGFTKSVLEEAQRLTQLTIQLLQIAKTDNNKMKLMYEDVNLEDLIRTEGDKFTPIADTKTITLIYHKPVNPPIIFADKHRIIQLIDILLDNAIKYNIEGGQIDLSTKSTKNAIKLIITDTGIGIPKEQVDKIFDRFYRITNDRHNRGFGLGLSIAKEIVNEHKAKIEVESVENKGTTIRVIFPHRHHS